jgi:hypothetical protein
MDDKFRKVLERAFHPTTGDGEAQAAFYAARRMAASDGLNKLLGASATPQVREVVRERVVYREPRYTDSVVVTFKISARWQHSFMERIWQDAEKFGLKIEIRHCRCRNKTVDSGLDLKIEVFGGPNGIRAWDRNVDSYLAEMNSKNKGQPPPRSTVQGEDVPRKPSFWTKLKALFKD